MGMGTQSFEETNFIAQFHTHLSSFSIEERTKPSEGDIAYKKSQMVHHIKLFLILTRGFGPIEY